jgi:hypothetical protein
MSEPEANAAANLISVKTELVHEFVIGRILDEIKQRQRLPLSTITESALQRGPLGGDLAAAVARAGYLARVIESELFVPARTPSPHLEEKLRDAGIDPAEAEGVLSAVALELAQDEPEERPDPDDPRAVSWQIPGPGGHVRHYVALGTAEWLSEAPEHPGPARSRPEVLKPCWMYGFFLRCCEEVASPSA